VRRFHQLPYRAREWGRSRKLVARVEATALGTDVRTAIFTNVRRSVSNVAPRQRDRFGAACRSECKSQ
jgi:hypothetical protein